MRVQRRSSPYWIAGLAALAGAANLELTTRAQAQLVDYDIVYVRWPRNGGNVVMLPQGEDAYRTLPGADLVLLHPDGSQRVLVDCTACCVQDPTVSFDGEWVYYTKQLDANNVRSPSLLFKMHIGGPNADFREVQLTFDDGFTGYLHAGNSSDVDDLESYFSLRDMGPAQLPGGKLAFTSNRHAVIPFRQGTHFNLTDCFKNPVMQIYVMDDHDGRLVTSDLANLHQVGFGSLHMVLHPIILTDGRLLFTNWDDASGKFFYAMSTLYAMNPDGTNLVAFTEPHDHHKNVDHFATQISDGSVVTGQYYPSYNFGFGHLLRFPTNIPDPAFTKTSSTVKDTYIGYFVSYRNYDRKGLIAQTPHTSPSDCVAPNQSGKYAMPAAAPLGSMLVAYSPGGVNHNSTCVGTTPQVLDSGVYLMPDAVHNIVTDPTNPAQLMKILNSPDYNEIWPRPVVTYAEIHGISEPKNLPATDSVRPADDRLEPGEPHAIVGTSSLYNRESAPIAGDPFHPSTGREGHPGIWMIQGTDAGVVKNSDIYGVRIVGVVPKPFRQPISRSGANSADYAAASGLLYDGRADNFVEGYASVHSERWKILGEFPVRKFDDAGNQLVDPKGDFDTSFAAKIPADVPYFYQGIDKNGMTLFSEMTWRSSVAGEVRTDCGGCHAHSIAPVEFSGTAAGRRVPIKANGISSSDPMIANGLWDLTQKTPLLATAADGSTSVRTVPAGLVGAEYYRDVMPILTARCVSCHSTAGNKSGTDLAFDGTTRADDAYFRLVKDNAAKYGGAPPGGNYTYPQLSRYVRANQARQSLIVWKLFGQRLDGRLNTDRTDDLDFTPHSGSHGATAEECRTIARWIDLGCPINFTSAGHVGFRYTDDNTLPMINIGTPARGMNLSFDNVLRIGVSDGESPVNWSSLSVSLDTSLADGVNPVPVSLSSLNRPVGSSVAYITLPSALQLDREMLLVVTVADTKGNSNRAVQRFWISSDPNTTPEGIPPRPDIAAPLPPDGDGTTVATNDPSTTSGTTGTTGTTDSTSGSGTTSGTTGGTTDGTTSGTGSTGTGSTGGTGSTSGTTDSTGSTDGTVTTGGPVVTTTESTPTPSSTGAVSTVGSGGGCVASNGGDSGILFVLAVPFLVTLLRRRLSASPLCGK